jgi:hypothetical protein
MSARPASSSWRKWAEAKHADLDEQISRAARMKDGNRKD